MANETFYQDNDARLWNHRDPRLEPLREYVMGPASGSDQVGTIGSTGPSPGPEPSAPSDHREVSQHTAGVKLDDGKPDASLLQDFGRALLEVALVGTYGKVKYSRGGWRSVADGINRYTAAMQRHFFAEKRRKYDAGDPFYDTPAGLPYKGRIREAAQTAWNALARLELILEEEENGSK